MKVIITGECGFIGSNLAEELIKEHYVVIIDNISTGRVENIQNLQNNENFEFVRGSITDLNLLTQIFEGADCIFHQAAIPSVQRSIENPIATNEANIQGTLNVFNRCERLWHQKSRLRLIIFSLRRSSKIAKEKI